MGGKEWKEEKGRGRKKREQGKERMEEKGRERVIYAGNSLVV